MVISWWRTSRTYVSPLNWIVYWLIISWKVHTWQMNTNISPIKIWNPKLAVTYKLVSSTPSNIIYYCRISLSDVSHDYACFFSHLPRLQLVLEVGGFVKFLMRSCIKTRQMLSPTIWNNFPFKIYLRPL